MNLNEKLARVFHKNQIIDKSLSRFSAKFGQLPSYVIDYILNQFVDPSNPSEGLNKAQKLIDNHYIGSDQREKIKGLIRRNNQHYFIGNLIVRYDSGKDEFWATIDVLGDSKIRIVPTILEQYEDILLVRGCYGKMKVEFDPTFVIGKNLFPFVVTDFVPLQNTQVNLQEWVEKRDEFETEEWIDILINSFGFSPDQFDFDTKIFYLCRMIPFVENNINIVEFGPTETGKTYAYRSISNYGFVMSGSNVTVASLFYNKIRRKIGLIGYNDVIMFDEISGVQFNNQSELINMLKDYMNSGHFGRDQQDFAANSSIVFGGNISCDRDNKKVSNIHHHLFVPFPYQIRNDRAFLDRIHGYLPGWVAHQISSSILSNNYGFMADYLSEIFHQLRTKNYAHIIAERVKFNNMSQRNQNAITKLSSGLLKLIYPNALYHISNKELQFIINIAVELRQRVIDQIHIIASKEFVKTNLSQQLEIINVRRNNDA